MPTEIEGVHQAHMREIMMEEMAGRWKTAHGQIGGLASCWQCGWGCCRHWTLSPSTK